MNHKLEYVLSGTSYVRLTNPSIAKDPENVKVINDLFDHFFNGKYSHSCSLLYNAYAESGFGERMQPFKNHLNNIHADSGGLQMITLGKTITPELKDKVYENQAKWADVGMCFDEIPLILTGERSERNATRDRYFDKDNFEHYARLTGKNIKRQIEVFKATESKCKPFLILQGHCYDTYMQWYDWVLDEIPQSDHHLIGGVALGAAALGTGPLEDVQRAFIASQIPWHQDKMHLHILGVGSIRRLLPYLIFCQTGLYDRMEISYDSTTHSRAVETGLYYINRSTMKYSRAKDDKYRIILEDVKSQYPELDVDKDKFYEMLNTPGGPWMEKYGSVTEWSRTRTAMIFGCVSNFMKHVEEILHSKEKLLDFANNIKLDTQYRALYNIKNKDDFDYWMNNPYLGKAMKTMPISDEAPETLVDLFS
jgi:hypothetical protein